MSAHGSDEESAGSSESSVKRILANGAEFGTILVEKANKNNTDNTDTKTENSAAKVDKRYGISTNVERPNSTQNRSRLLSYIRSYTSIWTFIGRVFAIIKHYTPFNFGPKLIAYSTNNCDASVQQQSSSSETNHRKSTDILDQTRHSDNDTVDEHRNNIDSWSSSTLSESDVLELLDKPHENTTQTHGAEQVCTVSIHERTPSSYKHRESTLIKTSPSSIHDPFGRILKMSSQNYKQIFTSLNDDSEKLLGEHGIPPDQLVLLYQLELNAFLKNKLFQCEKYNRIRFNLGPSLYGRRIALFTNYHHDHSLFNRYVVHFFSVLSSP